MPSRHSSDKLYYDIVMTVQNVPVLSSKADTLNKKLGLYVHVPFCAKKCEFCAFYKESADRAKIDQFLEGIEEELKKFPPAQEISTIFFGGGTPTLLNTKDLERLCQAVKKASGDKFTEWSVECAPGTLKEDKLMMMKEIGVTRYSLGVQSFSARALEAIGRPHTVEQTKEAIKLLKNSTKNWNIDLIFAAADSTIDEWTADLMMAIDYAPNHISTYCLTFESDTALFLKMLKGSKKRPTAEEEARFYLKTWEILKNAGYHHYEVANFAKPGNECQHNLSTWHMNDWVGYGPSAASQVNGRRYSNLSDLSSWREGIRQGARKLVDEEHLTTHQLAVDALMFGLRLPDGVDVAEIQSRFAPFDNATLSAMAQTLQSEGLLKTAGARWALTDDGLLVADAVGELLNERLG